MSQCLKYRTRFKVVHKLGQRSYLEPILEINSLCLYESNEIFRKIMCDEAVGLHAIKSFVSAGGLGSRVLLQLPFYKHDLWSIVPCKCC